MWLCLNNAFLSIVHKDCAADELLVRARRDGDIERVFPTAQVRIIPGHDYRCRAIVKRSEVTAALNQMVAELSYKNFKDAVRDPKLHSAYMSVWSTMGKLQSGGPYHS